MKKLVSKGLCLALIVIGAACSNSDVVSPNQAPAVSQEAGARKPAAGQTVSLEGTTTVDGIVQQVTGTLNITQFVVDNGQLLAVGTITDSSIPQLIGQVIQLPVNLLTSTGTCQILNLDLGPLSLNLLGLQIDLSAIDLDITAQQGPGNLVGNLLCAIAGLLDGNNLTALAQLLNNLLGALR